MSHHAARSVVCGVNANYNRYADRIDLYRDAPPPPPPISAARKPHNVPPTRSTQDWWTKIVTFVLVALLVLSGTQMFR